MSTFFKWTSDSYLIGEENINREEKQSDTNKRSSSSFT